jgi:prepilin-type N-terminal cleavage/methylation domain-containing protein
LKNKLGFTLIELMIVVAIIGVLAGIMIPQFANLVAKAQEGRTKANMGTIRSALSIYYGDTEGWYPVAGGGNDLVILTTGGRYLQSIPKADLPRTTNCAGHGSVNTETNTAQDTAGWYYDAGGAGSSTWGKVMVNCSHQDLKAKIWTSY